MTQTICMVAGCGRTQWRRDWCNAHYHRWLRYGDPMVGQTYHGDGPFTLAMVLRADTDDCVLWPLGKTSTGYGAVWVDGAQLGTHAVVCGRTHGPRPTPDHEAAHTCGVRACVNHRHIRWATPAENAADKLLHGTHQLGERNHSSTLTAADVLSIRARSATETATAMAREFGVSRRAISSVITRRTWAWLDALPA